MTNEQKAENRIASFIRRRKEFKIVDAIDLEQRYGVSRSWILDTLSALLEEV